MRDEIFLGRGGSDAGPGFLVGVLVGASVFGAGCAVVLFGEGKRVEIPLLRDQLQVLERQDGVRGCG